MPDRSRRHVLHTAAVAGITPALTHRAAWAGDLADGSFRREVVALLGRRHPEWTIIPAEDPAHDVDRQPVDGAADGRSHLPGSDR